MRIDKITKLEKSLLDKLWGCNTHEEMIGFLDTLSTHGRRTADRLIELMIQEAIDDALDGVTDFPEVIEYLNNIT